MSARADPKRAPTMHDTVVAIAFLAMIVIPCIFAMRSGNTDEN